MSLISKKSPWEKDWSDLQKKEEKFIARRMEGPTFALINKLDRFIAARLTDPDDQGQVRKISAALFRRGYSWEEIRSALRRFQGEAGDY